MKMDTFNPVSLCEYIIKMDFPFSLVLSNYSDYSKFAFDDGFGTFSLVTF